MDSMVCLVRIYKIWIIPLTHAPLSDWWLRRRPPPPSSAWRCDLVDGWWRWPNLLSTETRIMTADHHLHSAIAPVLLADDVQRKLLVLNSPNGDDGIRRRGRTAGSQQSSGWWRDTVRPSPNNMLHDHEVLSCSTYLCLRRPRLAWAYYTNNTWKLSDDGYILAFMQITAREFFKSFTGPRWMYYMAAPRKVVLGIPRRRQRWWWWWPVL